VSYLLLTPFSPPFLQGFQASLDGLAVAAPGLHARIQAVLDVFGQCLDRWALREVALSFNGGKDCTVLLHLLVHFMSSRGCPVEKGSGCEGTLHGLRVVFFETETGFPEVASFMSAMEALYGFRVRSLPGLKSGLAVLVEEGVQAVLLGTRRTDPHGGGCPRGGGWWVVGRVGFVAGCVSV
jgi:FAD synthetase